MAGAVGQTGFLLLGWSAGERSLQAILRRSGRYPLTRDGAVQADPQTSLELKATQDRGPWSVALAVLNAFNWRAYNQEYWYVSRLPGEPLAGVADRHHKSADPQAIRIEAGRRF